MSVLKSTVSSSEPMFCDNGDNQWSQETSSSIPQTVTESDLYKSSPASLTSVPSNTPPPAYHAHSLSLGVNGDSFVQSVSLLSSGIPNEVTSLNIPHGLNGVMLRPNGNEMSITKGFNRYANTAVNQRFLPRPATWITPTKPINGVKKQKRNRTAFTSQQMMELEHEYSRSRYLDRTRRIELSEILQLNERTIKIWFQNRRMKEKKDRAESFEDSEEVTTSESSPELGISSTIPMPIVNHEQYPTTVTNDVHNQGMYSYMDYQVQSAPTFASTMPQGRRNQLGEYAEYISPDIYEAQYHQAQLQMQHHPSLYSNDLEAVHAEPSALQPDSCSPAQPSTVPEKNWDVSWIRSMHSDEEL